MSLRNKELAVDVAREYIRAHTKQITAAATGVSAHETTMIKLETVNNIIKSVHETLEEIDQSEG